MSAVSSADHSSFDSNFARVIAQPAYRGFLADHAGAANRQLQLTRNCSAVSSACMLTRREIFQEVGGFDANLSGALADVDLCLKIRRAGYLIVYTPFARLYWHDAPGKIDTAGQGIMEQRWAGLCMAILITIQIFLASARISR